MADGISHGIGGVGDPDSIMNEAANRARPHVERSLLFRRQRLVGRRVQERPGPL